MKWIVAPLLSLLVVVSWTARVGAADVSVSADEVRSLTSEAADVRQTLYIAVNAQEPSSADFVNITIFGGLPPPSRFTMYITPSIGGGFRAEVVDQERAFVGAPKLPRHKFITIAPETSRKIASLLNAKAMWKEPEGRSGGCTDQPVLALEVVWKGMKRNAVRLACAPSDLTGSLIEIGVAQADER